MRSRSSNGFSADRRGGQVRHNWPKGEQQSPLLSSEGSLQLRNAVEFRFNVERRWRVTSRAGRETGFRTNGQWRFCFRWTDAGTGEVRIVDCP